ncbi:MAG: acyl-CoA dehydrogenase, partial [Gammaproteobacteria bacterium]
MDLSFGSEYTVFREEVCQFVQQYKDKQPPPDSQYGKETLAWQKLLIENGYHSRTIPKEYG